MVAREVDPLKKQKDGKGLPSLGRCSTRQWSDYFSRRPWSGSVTAAIVAAKDEAPWRRVSAEPEGVVRGAGLVA
jgi:hypothetical protein